MSSPLQYSSVRLASGSTQGLAANFGSSLQINFSGQSVNNLPSVFTVGGWVRMISQQTYPSSSVVFSATNQFQIAMDSNGMLSALFLSGTGAVTADVSVIDGNWHYIAVSFLQSSESSNGGILQLYIDGFQIDAEDVTTTCTLTPGDCFLGQNAAFMDFVSWSIWSVPVPSDVLEAPLWGPPAAGSEASEGLVAAWDFSAGTAIDVSGNGCSVTISALYWNTPCLSLNADASVLPASTDELNPGGSGAFTVAVWVYLPTVPPPTLEESQYYWIFKNQWNQNQYNLNLNVGFDPNVVIYEYGQFAYTGPSYCFGAATYPPLPTYQWVYLALTYDGTTWKLYGNGIENASALKTVPTFSNGSVSVGESSSVPAGTTWYMQGLAMFTTCLSQTSLQSYMSGADPTGSDGCVAYFPFMMDFGNTVTGSTATATGALITELTTQITAGNTDVGTPSIVAEAHLPKTPIPGDIALMRPADFRALAAKNGIDVNTTPDPTAMASGPYAETVAWYETILKGLPSRTAAKLRAEFHRNLQIGMSLHDKGIRTGSFNVAVEGNDTVVYYHAETGLYEVYRFQDNVLTPYQQWCLTIGIDVLGIVASMLGILTTAAQVTNAVGLFEDLLPAVGAAAQNTATGTQKAINAIWDVLKVFWEWKAIGSMIYKIITASWWSLTFTVLSIVAQIVALISSGGYTIALKVAQMAISIGNLVYDLSNMPPNQNSAPYVHSATPPYARQTLV